MDSLGEIKSSEDPRNNEIKTLLQSISLTKGKLLERRRDIKKSLVILALDQLSENSPFTIDNIIEKIAEIGKCVISKEDIVTILDDCITKGTISHSEEYTYKLNKKIELPGIELLTESVWCEFSARLKTKWPKYDPFLHKKSRTVFDSILVKILTRYALSKPLDDEIDYIPIEDIKSVIQTEININSIDGEFAKKLFEISLDYFTSDEKELLKCIINCYLWFIDLNLLSYQKKIQSINFCDEINFVLLDTNFIVTLLCKTDVKHPLSRSLIEFCKNSKVPVYYSELTKGEVWNLINTSKNEMKLNPYRLVKNDNQFIDDYRYLNTTRGIHYSEYIIVLNKWIEFLEAKYQIKPLPSQFSQGNDNIDFEYTKNTLPMLYDVQSKERARRSVDYRVRKRSEGSYSHDAYCISLISFLKKNPQIFLTKKELGPWFLSYDSLVSDLNNHYFRKNNDFGYVIQPRILLNYFLAFSKIQYDEKNIETLAKALLRYTVRNPKNQISLDEYSKELSVKIGSDEDNADILKELLVKMPLFHEMENALQFGNVVEADHIFCDFIAHPALGKIFEEMVNNKKSESEKDLRIKELAKKVREKETELIKEKSAREALERNSGMKINIIIPTIIGLDPAVSSKITELIVKLNEINAFNSESIPKPPQELNASNVRLWVERIKTAIQTTSVIADTASVYLIINQILAMIPK